MLRVQANFRPLFEKDFDHRHTTRFKDNFLYHKHCFHLVENPSTHMGKRCFKKLLIKSKQFIKRNMFKGSLADTLICKTYQSIMEQICKGKLISGYLYYYFILPILNNIDNFRFG